MKIRSKLTLSFSLLFGLALAILAAVFYRTFEQSIEPSRQELFALRSQAMAATLDLQLHEAAEAVRLFTVRYPVDRLHIEARDAASERAFVYARASEFIAGTPAIASLGLRIASADERFFRIGAGDTDDAVYQLLLEQMGGTLSAADETHAIATHDHTVYVLVPRPGPAGDVSVWIAGLDMAVISLRLRDYFRRNDPNAGSVTIVSGDKVVMSLAKGGQQALDDAAVRRINARLTAALAMPVPSLLHERTYLFPALAEKLPWRVIYGVPDNRYWLGIAQLRNELGLTLVLMLLVALYVIYLLSLRITRPLQELQRASRMSMEQNYENPVFSDFGKDEIGDLARTFEVQRRRIGRLINRDELTGAYNRRYFMMALGREVARAKRHDSRLCVMMIDADHFKSINDRLGHACGDAALIHLGRLLADSIREYDVVGRLGGEEFAVCAPGASLEQAANLADRIRQSVADSHAQCREHAVRMTVSLGVAEYCADGDADALLHRADDALYRAKRDGRNRVEIADPPDARS